MPMDLLKFYDKPADQTKKIVNNCVHNFCNKLALLNSTKNLILFENNPCYRSAVNISMGPFITVR